MIVKRVVFWSKNEKCLGKAFLSIPRLFQFNNRNLNIKQELCIVI